MPFIIINTCKFRNLKIVVSFAFIYKAVKYGTYELASLLVSFESFFAFKWPNEFLRSYDFLKFLFCKVLHTLLDLNLHKLSLHSLKLRFIHLLMLVILKIKLLDLTLDLDLEKLILFFILLIESMKLKVNVIDLFLSHAPFII